MRKSSWKKSLVFMIIGLFIGISFMPSISANQVNSLTIDSVISRLMHQGHIPSLAACIIKNDHIVWNNSYGYSDIENNSLTSISTAYLIGSISKVVTATAIFQLSEKGLLNISDDVNKYLDFKLVNPYYPNVPITIEMLLSHTSSLAFENLSFYHVYYNQDPPWLISWMENYFYKNGSIIDNRWRHVKPGTIMRYSNLGFTVLGRVVEIVSNMSFNDYCKENILTPLKMNNSSFILSDLSGMTIAKPYVYIDNRPYDYYLPLPYYSVCFYPAGGLWATVEDLSHFLSAQMNGGVYQGVRILNASTVQYMHEHNLGWYSRLGWICFRRPLLLIGGFGGGMYGYNTWMTVRTNQNAGLIVFINRYIDLDHKATIDLKLILNLLVFKANFYH